MERRISRNMKILAVVAALVVMTSGIIALLSGVGMGGNDMSRCPFMAGESSVCHASAVAHLGAWQQLFSATLPYTLLITLFMLVVAFILRTSRMMQPLLAFAGGGMERGAVRVFNSSPHYLARAFARGILHPKKDHLSTL